MYVYIYIYPEVVEYGHDKKQATKKGASLTKNGGSYLIVLVLLF